MENERRIDAKPALDLLRVDEAAALCGVRGSTLTGWHKKRLDAPPYMVLGHKRFYVRAEVIAWLQSRPRFGGGQTK